MWLNCQQATYEPQPNNNKTEHKIILKKRRLKHINRLNNPTSNNKI